MQQSRINLLIELSNALRREMAICGCKPPHCLGCVRAKKRKGEVDNEWISATTPIDH